MQVGFKILLDGSTTLVSGNSDGVYECYYFGSDGYLLENTLTPDGYTVDSDGAWTENGEVKTITFNDDIVLGFYADSEFHFVPGQRMGKLRL